MGFCGGCYQEVVSVTKSTGFSTQLCPGLSQVRQKFIQTFILYSPQPISPVFVIDKSETYPIFCEMLKPPTNIHKTTHQYQYLIQSSGKTAHLTRERMHLERCILIDRDVARLISSTRSTCRYTRRYVIWDIFYTSFRRSDEIERRYVKTTLTSIMILYLPYPSVQVEASGDENIQLFFSPAKLDRPRALRNLAKSAAALLIRAKSGRAPQIPPRLDDR